MNIGKWFSSLFKSEDEEEESSYKCPKCGSDKLGYFSSLTNFVQVVNGLEEPQYSKSAVCIDCGFRSVQSDFLRK